MDEIVPALVKLDSKSKKRFLKMAQEGVKRYEVHPGVPYIRELVNGDYTRCTISTFKY